MDRTDPQVATFAATLAAIDDDTLAALANKGLVRRARKDIEKTAPTIVGADEQSVSLDVERARVKLANPVSKSTCTCASGMCRHILGAVIFLREAPHGGPERSAGPRAVSEQLLSLDEEALQKWAPKALLKRAAIVLSRGYELQEEPIILISLPAQNVTVRLLGATPDAMICSCHAPGACEHKVAAVLAFQAHRTGRAVQVPQAILDASSGAPRSREEVRDAVATLMREIVALGLCRISAVTQQRLRTLATSAHGVDLPRLERMLKALSDEVALTLSRDAQASSASLLSSASRIFALCAALDHPTPALVGEHRSVYMPVAGSLDLIGLGARRWRTRSGYHGLTVFFWEPSSKRWTGWTDARPIGAPGFDPVTRFDEDGPWPGSANPRQAAMSKWRLSGAHRNGVGRITARSNTRGILSSRSTPDEGPALRDFAQLAEFAKQAFAPGLADRRDHADLVLLAPEKWADANYDPITQQVTRFIADANGQIIPLLLRHSPETDHALTTLQRIDGATVRALLGSLRIGSRGLFVEPITLWTDVKPIHLTLDGAPARSIQPNPAAQEEPDAVEDLDEAEQESTQVIASPIGQMLTHIESELIAIAEGGVEVIRDLSPLRAAAKECNALGLIACSKALANLSDELDRFRKSIQRSAAAPAEQLLRAAYLAHLATECASVCLAVPV